MDETVFNNEKSTIIDLILKIILFYQQAMINN